MKRFFLILMATAALFASCNFFRSADEIYNPDWEGKVTAISLDKTRLSIEGGSADVIALKIEPEDVRTKVNPRWTFSFIEGAEDCFSIDGNSSNCTVTGRRVGKGYLKCTLNNITATCLIDVTSNDPEFYQAQHYIYSSDPGVIELTPDSYKNISVSLFNGSSDDYENFTWSVTNENIATISTARNNCTVTARSIGSTQIKVQNPKAEYEYTFVVYVYNDLSKGVPYITTKTNVVTLNTAQATRRTIEFQIANDQSRGASASRYSYEDTTKSGPGSIVEITNSNSNTLQVTAIPNKSGQAEITVQNDYCEYPLKVIVVVSNIVQNVYVTTSESTVQISDDNLHTIYAYLNGYDGAVDTEGFTWSIEPVKSAMPNYFPVSDSSGNDIGWQSYLDFTYSGDVCQITGKKNGVFKIRAGHSRSPVSRTVVVILTNQKGSAIDASMFITTSQNYVQTKVNGDPIEIVVTLVGGVPGDQQDFIWTVSSDDGDPLQMLSCTSIGSGNVKSRSALTAGTDAYGKIEIIPNQTENPTPTNAIGPYGGEDGLPGTVKIEISHPKCLYTAEVIVKIFSKWALLAPEVKIDVLSEKDGKMVSTSLVKSLYSDLESGFELEAQLENSDDYSKLEWSAEGDSPLVEPDSGFLTGKRTLIKKKSGVTTAGMTYIKAHHADALADRKVLFLTADTQAELDSLKGFYAEQTCLRISEDPKSADHTAKIQLKSFGFASDDSFRVNFSPMNSNVVAVENTSRSYKGGDAIEMIVTGLKAGKTTVEVSLPDYPSAAKVLFDVFVVAKGEAIGVNEVKYLTTRQNAVVIPQINQSVSLEAIGVGITQDAMNTNTNWKFKAMEPNGSPVTDVIDGIPAKGAKATVTAMKTGKTLVNVTNSESVNDLDINVKVGDIYEYEDNFFCYITSDQDTYQLVKGEEIDIGAALVNSSAGGTGWKWEAVSLTGGNQSNITVTPSSANPTTASCHIKADEAGQVYLRVTHPLAVAEKELLIVIGNSLEELNGLAYLTTNQNVVTVGEQSNVTVQIQVQNAAKQIVNGFMWSSSNPEIVSVVGSGTTAVFYGNKMGTAVITVTNYDSGISYPLEIIANCVDPIAAAENPYIACENIVTISVGDRPYELSAQLIGGTASDNINFMWSVVNNDPKITIRSSNETCQITGNSVGVAQIRIRHPKALGADRTVLVIVNNQAVVDCEILTSDSLLQTLSPDGNSINLTVTLDKGTAADNHSFSWFADNYTAAELKANENTCLVTPKAPGFVNVSVSHPRAKYEKTFRIQITAATTFAFDYSADVITLTEGKDQIISMKVPTLDVDSQYVTYKSMDTSIVDFGLNSSTFCTLKAKKKGQTTIEAVLYGTKNGQTVEFGRTTKYVYVNEADNNARYVKLTSGSDINIMNYDKMDYNKTDSIVLKAEAYSDNPDILAALQKKRASSNLQWKIETINGEKSLFSCVPPNCEGDSIKLTPVATGTAKLTISLPSSVEKGVESKSVYLVVNGADALTLTLPKSIDLQERGGSAIVKATLKGGDASAYNRIMWDMYEDPDGKVRHTSGNIASFSGKGGSVNVTGDMVGKVYLIASVTSINPENTNEEILVKDVCEINVTQKPEIKFAYTDMILMPETEYFVPYTIVPANDDEIMFPVESSDSAVARVVQDKSTYDKATGTGKICILTGTKPKLQDERVVLTARTKTRRLTGAITASIGYNCLFTWDKALISSLPDKTSKSACDSKGCPLVFEYTVRPANSKIEIQWPVQSLYYGSKNLRMYGGENCTIKEKAGSSGGINKIYEVYPDASKADPQTGIVKGKVMFYTDGEVNTTLKVEGISQNITYKVLNMENEGKEFTNGSGSGVLAIKSFYSSHTIKVKTDANGYINSTGRYSAWNDRLNAIVIGDGEKLTLDFYAVEGAVQLVESGTGFSPNSGERGAQNKSDQTLRNFKISNSQVSEEKQGKRLFFALEPGTTRGTLSHNLDYGWDYNPAAAESQTGKQNSQTNSVPVFNSILGAHTTDKDVDLQRAAYDTTIRYTEQAGTLAMRYFDYASGETKVFNIKVYVECRNSKK